MEKGYCIICQKEITEKLCYKCRTEKLADWLMDLGTDQAMILRSISHIYNHFDSLVDESFCEACGKIAPVCTHCYFSSIKNILKFHFSQDITDQLMLWLIISTPDNYAKKTMKRSVPEAETK